MANTPPWNSATYNWFLREGQRLEESYSHPSAQQSVKLFEIQLKEVSGGRNSTGGARQSIVCLPANMDIHEVYEAMNELLELGKENPSLVDEEIVKWFEDIVEAYIGEQDMRAKAEEHRLKDLEESLEHAGEEDDEEGEVERGAEDRSSTYTFDSITYSPFEEGDDPNTEDWVEEIYQRDHAAKRKEDLFVGGADEVDNGFDVEYCPHCNKPVGDEIDQHILKCKFAHEELERLHWSLGRGEGKGRPWSTGRET